MKKQAKVKELQAVNEDADEVVPDRFKSLTDKEREFCRAYIQDWNGTDAAVKVFDIRNRDTAKTRASNLTTRKRILDYCDYLNENLEFATGVSRSWVMEQHLKIVRCSIAHLHESWIDRVEFDKLTPEQKDCIEEITTQTRTETAEDEDGETSVQVDYVKIKLYNKQKSLEAITKMMGYDKAQRIDITSGGKPLEGSGTTNVQINIYNTAPPLADSEKNIKD